MVQLNDHNFILIKRENVGSMDVYNSRKMTVHILLLKLLILRYGIKDVDTVATKECRHVSEIK
jgi:hypothetical protein